MNATKARVTAHDFDPRTGCCRRCGLSQIEMYARLQRLQGYKLIDAAFSERSHSEGYRCRCCLSRRAESLHELRSAGAMGSRMKATNVHNSIAVCGRRGEIGSMPSCHTYLQNHLILWAGDAEGTLTFTPVSPEAQRWMGTAS